MSRNNNIKGSLSLSVNAIVILVLAIAMLGLGIAFTKGKFSELSKNIEIPAPNIPATADDPIVIPTNEVEVSTNRDTILSINIYNNGQYSGTQARLPQIDCRCESTPLVTKTFLGQGQVVPIGEYKTFKVTVTKDDLVGHSGDKCLCSIYHPDLTTGSTASKQITFNVRG